MAKQIRHCLLHSNTAVAMVVKKLAQLTVVNGHFAD